MTCSSNTICRPDPHAYRGLAIALALSAVLPGALISAANASQSAQESAVLVRRAGEFLSRGDAIAAQSKLREALDKGASRSAVAARMGRALLEQDRPVQARRWLEHGAFSRATAVEGYRALAALELREGNLHAAANAYDRALTIAPGDAGLWTEIARFRYVGGEHLLAIEASDHALALDADNASALRLRAELVRDRNGMIPALGWFERALEKSPGDVSLMGEYAATLGEAGRAVDMLAMTRRMLELDPGNPRAFYLQSVMAARAGNFSLARTLLNKTRGKLDGMPGAMLLEGIVEISAGNYTLAIEALDPLVRQQPANRRASELLARAMFLSGEYGLLLSRYAGMVAQDRASSYLKMLVARSYEQIGRRDLAAPLLDSVAKEGSRSVQPVPTHEPIGAMLAAGDAAGADQIVNGWLQSNPGNYDNLALAGDVQLAQGNGREAMRLYERAARIKMPESLLARRFQAMLMAGAMRPAVELVDTSLANNPASVEARRLAAWLSAYSGDWTRSRRLYENLASAGRQRDLQLLSDLALVQVKDGAPETGEETARRSYRLYRAHPVAAQAWCVALAADGRDAVKARALLAKARRMMGDTPLLSETRLKLAGNIRR